MHPMLVAVQKRLQNVEPADYTRVVEQLTLDVNATRVRLFEEWRQKGDSVGLAKKLHDNEVYSAALHDPDGVTNKFKCALNGVTPTGQPTMSTQVKRRAEAAQEENKDPVTIKAEHQPFTV